MQRITLLNPKGGCGKTTIATNLASWLATAGRQTVLYDLDSQGSSTHWLSLRSPELPKIHGVPAFRTSSRATRSWQLRVPAGTDRVIVDTPASVAGPQLDDIIRRSDRILIPLLASPIDFDAFVHFAPALARAPRVQSGDVKIAVIVNRVRRDTSYYRTLDAQLPPVLAGGPFDYVTALRDTQNYVRAGTRGCGLSELNSRRTIPDETQWIPLLRWLGEHVPGTDDPHLASNPRQHALDLKAKANKRNRDVA